MSRILITVADGAVVDVSTDIPDAVVYLRDHDVIRERTGLFMGDADQLASTYLRPEELDVLLLAGTLPQKGSRVP